MGVPIVPIQRTWVKNKVTHTRTMLPLIPGYAISIHKAQGMSLDEVIVDLGPCEFCAGLTYTALSRCKKCKNLALDPFPEKAKKRFLDMQKKKTFLAKLKEDKKILLYEIETLKSDKL